MKQRWWRDEEMIQKQQKIITENEKGQQRKDTQKTKVSKDTWSTGLFVGTMCCISTYLYLIPASTCNKCTGIHEWIFPMLIMSCAKKTTTKTLSEPKNAEKRIFSKKNRDIVTWLSSDLHFLEANNSCIHSHLIYTHLFHKCICCVLHWITMQLWNSLVCVNTTGWQQYLLKHTSLQSQRAVFNRLCSCADHSYW